MAFTEPTSQTGYIRGRALDKMEWLRRYIYGFGLSQFFTRIGPEFTFHLPGRVGTYPVDCDIIPSDRNNSTRTITGHERAARACLTELERNNLLRFNGAGMAIMEEQANAINLFVEEALDALLVTSTNTITLGTDNQITREEYFKGLLTIQKYAPASRIVVWTSSIALAADALDNSLATEAVQVTTEGIQERISLLPMNVPMLISQTPTNSTATGGTAMYMWAQDGIIGGYDGVENKIDSEWSTLNGGYNMMTKGLYAFDFVEGVADPRVVRFVNP